MMCIQISLFWGFTIGAFAWLEERQVPEAIRAGLEPSTCLIYTTPVEKENNEF
jgi:hypothetical protein